MVGVLPAWNLSEASPVPRPLEYHVVMYAVGAITDNHPQDESKPQEEMNSTPGYTGNS